MQRPFSLLIILLCFILANCDHSLHKNNIPFFANRVLNALPAEKQPVKVEMDLVHKQLYWLNKIGEIYRIQADGTQVKLINKGIGAKLGVTYIEDFCLDTINGYIYFTDLFDLKTGESAIKRSTLAGDHIETLTTFVHEIPIEIKSQPDSHTIYFITQSIQNLPQVYHLGVIEQGTREKIMLYTSQENLSFDQLADATQGNEQEAMLTHTQEITLKQTP